jgi:DNA-binding FadR family transcriptional regulator
MPLRTIQSRSLADQVFEQLAAEIMADRYPPGNCLPAERTLATIFDVNRHVVREALKRLEQIGLVRIAHGGSTRVRNFRQSAGLDLLAIMAEHAHGGDEAVRYLLAVLEMRAAIGVDVVRLCALRASQEVRDSLVALAAQMAAAADDDAAIFALEVQFWERLQDGADNVAYRLAFNSLVRGSLSVGALARDYSLKEVRSTAFRQPLAAAIAAGDAEKAAAMTRDAMRAAVDEFAAGYAAPETRAV